MQEFYGFFDGVFLGHDEEGYEKYDREYNAQELSDVLGAFFKDGVFPKPSTGLLVESAEDFQVKVHQGQSFINKRFYWLKEATYLRIEDPDINFNRIDRIVVQFDSDKREISLKVKSGIPASNAKAPSLVRNDIIYEISLAEVTIRSKSNSLAARDIKDTRFDENLCGIVATAIDELDVADIRLKYDKSLNELIKIFESFINNEQGHLLDLIKELNRIIESEGAAGEIISMLNKKQDKVIKDTKNENEYMVEITDGRPFLRVVK